MDTAVNDSTILLDQYHLPQNGGLSLVDCIVEGSACIVSNSSFNTDSSLGPTGTSAVVVVLTPSTNYATKFYVKGNN